MLKILGVVVEIELHNLKSMVPLVTLESVLFKIHRDIITMLYT